MLELFRNYKLKLLALMLGTLTWFLISRQIVSDESSFMLPIKIKVADNMEVVNTSQRFVRIDVLGTSAELKKFDPQTMPVIIDLTREQQKKTKTLPIDITRIKSNLPGQLKVLEFMPKELEATIDRLDKKRLPVEVSITGTQQYGFKLIEAVPRPQFFVYEAATSMLEKVDAIYTEEIDISRVTGSFEQKVSLIDPITNEKLSSTVTAVIVIQPQYRIREFTDIPVKITFERMLDKKVVIAPEKITLSLEGRQDQLEQIDPNELLVYVNVTLQMDGSYQMQPTLVIPNAYATIKVHGTLPTLSVNVSP